MLKSLVEQMVSARTLFIWRLGLIDSVHACLSGFLPTLLRTVRDETVGDLSPIIWFATKVAQRHIDARDDPRFRELCEALSDNPGARALNTIMSSTVATSATDAPMAGEVLALEDVREHAGGRHSNDHADYRRIAIMPSVEEVSELRIAMLLC